MSINTSGHKFGLAYVGVGWIIFRDKAHLPKDLIFELHYLGSVEYSFSLNFSRPAAPIIAQYFNLIHLGFEGYRSIGLDDLKNARILSRALEKSGYYTVLSDIHRHPQGMEAVELDETDVEVRYLCFIYSLLLADRMPWFRATPRGSRLCRSGSRISSNKSTLKLNKSGEYTSGEHAAVFLTLHLYMFRIQTLLRSKEWQVLIL